MTRLLLPTLLLVLAASAAQAQQPPPGPRPPPPPHGAPPPGGDPRAGGGPQQFAPPPPPPPIVFMQQPPANEAAPVPASPTVPVAEAPKPPPPPGAVQPFPQLEDAKAPPALEFEADRQLEQQASANARALSELGPAHDANQLVQAPLPRWVWLVAGASLLLLLGWYAALRRSRALGEEAERLARTQRHLQSQHVQLKSQSEHLRQLATNDPLTGIFNRQAFSSELRKVLEHLQRFRRPLNLLLFDMDNFKQINDGQGHLVGDQAIKMVVGVVQEHLDSDDLFGRFGGDEFMIAIADQPLEKVQQLAEGIRLGVVRAAAAHVPSLGGLSLSIGIAQANESQGYAADALFQRADTALYAAKNTGRNRVVLADEALAPPPVLAAATRHLA